MGMRDRREASSKNKKNETGEMGGISHDSLRRVERLDSVVPGTVCRDMA